MSARGVRLFSEFGGHDSVEHRRKKLSEELRVLTEPRLKGTTIDHWVKYFIEKYDIKVPQLDRDGFRGDVVDVQLNARHFVHRFHLSSDSPGFVPTPGTRITFEVPYRGDCSIFNCRGSTVYGTFPYAEVGDGLVTYAYETVDHEVEKINDQFDRDLNQTESHLQSLVQYFQTWNSSIEGIVKQGLNERLDKFKKDDEFASKLKFPLKKRDDAPGTYKVPEIRKVATPAPIPAQKASTPADPTLEMEHYEHILTVVKNMVRVIECSPKAFSQMGEEDIRFHFLVQLNGQYEGMATGETFNFSGKTDILIRYSGQNLFVGECKFWRGPKGYLETIDQILGYLTWRDSKAAMFVFSKGVDPSVPVQKIPETTIGHPNYVKSVEYGDASSFRFIFKHPRDTSKELILTVMAFNIPS